jgi:hypothetical protein
LICWIFCTSGFFAAFTFVEAFCETDALVVGVIVAPAAGVVLALAAGVVGAGVVAGVVAAGVLAAAVALAFAAGVDLAFVFGVDATLALGEALEAGDFEFLLFRREFFVASGVALAAGVFSAFAFGATADGFFLFDFLSVFGVVAGVVPGDSVAVDSFTAEVLVFGAFVIVGFSVRVFFSGGPCFLDGCDASGVGS